MAAIRISGVIITYNEERHIAECIRSMEAVCDEIVVVDSFSTDRTEEICKELGVRFLQHPFEGHIQQKNVAMEAASHDYVLSLDADERLSEEMCASILAVKANWQGPAYSFDRLNNYAGKWLRFAWSPDRKTRLWDRRKGRWGGVNPHDKVEVDGEITRLKGKLIHYAYADLAAHMHQNIKFALIAADARHKRGKKVIFLWHILVNPAFKFIRLFIFKGGFLDGPYGFAFCALSAYISFLKYLRLWELNKKAAKK